MWADSDTKVDFLNYTEVAELAVDLIKDSRMLPVSIGIFGTWGTGKSSLLNLIEQGLDPIGDEESHETTKSNYLVVRFDAWLHQGYDDVRAALMEVIATSLLKTAEKNDATLVSKAKKFFQRINYFRATGLAVEVGALAMGVPTMGVVTKGAAALGDAVAGRASEEDVTAITAAGTDIRTRGGGLIEAERPRTPPQEIAAFRREFGELLEGLGRTLVVFVDNLDRCMPKQTIHTLEALRLFLFLPNTAFIVAADEEMVRHSVSEFFKDPSGRHVTDYLDKIIQVPMRVPRLGVQEVRAYMFLLFADASGVAPTKFTALRRGLERNLQQAWKDEPISKQAALQLLGPNPPDDVALAFEIADWMAPLLANSSLVQGNPRIVKRMLNVVRMRSRLAHRRGIPLDEALIAKLALFERCTDGASTAELYKSIQESPNGRPALLKTLEALGDDPKRFAEACPETWRQKHQAFIREWILLEPLLGDVDLRPAIYLSRETLPLRATRGGLSVAAADALRVLRKAANTSAPSAKAATTNLTPADHAMVMDALLADFKKHTDWRNPPPGFDGALILAEISPEAGEALGRYLRSVGGEKPAPWLRMRLKDETLFKGK